MGSLAAGGTLGILIPPSILLVLYGLTVGESIGRLFLAGFIPGILLAGVFMLMIGVASVIWPAVAPRQSGVRGSGVGRAGSNRSDHVHRAHGAGAGADLHRAGQHLFRLDHSVGGGRIPGVTGALALAIIYNFVRLFAGNIAEFCAEPRRIRRRRQIARGQRRNAGESGARSTGSTAEHFRNYCRFIVAMTMEACCVGGAFLGDDPVHPDGGVHVAVRCLPTCGSRCPWQMGRQLQPEHGAAGGCSWWCSTCMLGTFMERTP